MSILIVAILFCSSIELFHNEITEKLKEKLKEILEKNRYDNSLFCNNVGKVRQETVSKYIFRHYLGKYRFQQGQLCKNVSVISSGIWSNLV